MEEKEQEGRREGGREGGREGMTNALFSISLLIILHGLWLVC